MSKRHALALSLLGSVALAGCASRPPPAVVLRPVDIGERAFPSAVKIQTERGFGSGFVVRADGWIATNYHVVSGAKRVKVVFADGRSLDADQLRFDPAIGDLALAHVEAKGLRPLALGSSVGTKPGE